MSGRHWSGAIRNESFVTPSNWLVNNPKLNVSKLDFPDLHGSLYAYEQLVVWHGSSLSRQDWRNIENVKRHTLRGNATAPSNIKREDLLCLLGGDIILATKQGFITVSWDMTHHASLIECEPISQCANPWWWVAWGVRNGKSILALAQATRVQNSPDLDEIDFPYDAEIISNGRLVMNNDYAYWIGKDYGVWELNLKLKELNRLVNPSKGRYDLLVMDNGIGSVRTDPTGLLFEFGKIINGNYRNYKKCDLYDSRDILSDGNRIWIIGKKITFFDLSHSNERIDLDHMDCPLGTWISGTIFPYQEEARIVSLCQDQDITRLSVSKSSSGTTTILWEDTNINPMGFYCVDNCIFLYHMAGVIIIREFKS